MRLDLKLKKKAMKKLNIANNKQYLGGLAEKLPRKFKSGLVGKEVKLPRPTCELDETAQKEIYHCLARLSLDWASEIAETDRAEVLKSLNSWAKRKGWEICEHSWQTHAGVAKEKPRAQRSPFVVPRLTDEVMSTFFADIYERDEQIRAIHESVETMGDFANHKLLLGQWGSCKTKLMMAFQKWYGEDQSGFSRVAFVDGTTMTKAGLENWLLELAVADQMPEVLVVDELEKQPVANLSCLNNIMSEGVLAKLNARIKHRRHKVRMLIVGICNDLDELQRHSLGNAILDRFGRPLYCPRPSRQLCRQILQDMVSRFPGGGNPEWARLALEFGWEQLKERNIRWLKQHLSGRDRLLTGEYQRDLLSMLEKRRLEEEMLAMEQSSS